MTKRFTIVNDIDADEARREYGICRRRGHTPGTSSVSVGNERWQRCMYCGTSYRFEQRLIEKGAPE